MYVYIAVFSAIQSLEGDSRHRETWTKEQAINSKVFTGNFRVSARTYMRGSGDTPDLLNQPVTPQHSIHLYGSYLFASLRWREMAQMSKHYFVFFKNTIFRCMNFKWSQLHHVMEINVLQNLCNKIFHVCVLYILISWPINLIHSTANAQYKVYINYKNRKV